MKIIEEQKHFLALQAMPGDYNYIDISKLSISNYYMPQTLADIDSFTMCFTTEEIMSAIEDANIVEDKYLSGALCIADNQKHNPIKVITKDFLNDFDLGKFLRDNSEDKNLMNTILNKLSALVSDEQLKAQFRIATRISDINKMLVIIYNLPYLTQRKFMIYCIEKNNEKKEQVLKSAPELVRDKAA